MADTISGWIKEANVSFGGTYNLTRNELGLLRDLVVQVQSMTGRTGVSFGEHMASYLREIAVCLNSGIDPTTGMNEMAMLDFIDGKLITTSLAVNDTLNFTFNTHTVFYWMGVI